MAKFDKNRPYGECIPIENGIAYWQAPYHFDANFNHVNAKGEVQEWAEGNKAPPLRTKKVPTGLIMQEEQVVPTDEDGEVKTAAIVDAGGIDLVAWANGELKGIPFFTIRKAMVESGYESPETAIAAKDAILARSNRVEN
jgi:hypothetical protein